MSYKLENNQGKLIANIKALEPARIEISNGVADGFSFLIRGIIGTNDMSGDLFIIEESTGKKRRILIARSDFNSDNGFQSRVEAIFVS